MSDAFKEYESTGRIGEDKGVSVQPLVGPTATDYGKWISVKDRLPKERKNVLVYITGDADDEVYISCIHKDGKWEYKDTMMYETSWYQEVSHWMELPEPPE